VILIEYVGSRKKVKYEFYWVIREISNILPEAPMVRESQIIIVRFL